MFNFSYSAVPMALICTYYSIVVLLGCYIYFWKVGSETWVAWNVSYVKGLLSWLKLGVPGMFMVCAEWYVGLYYKIYKI